MKYKFILLFAIVFMLTPLAANAKQKTPMEKLDNISDEALQMVKLERYDDAKALLEYFSEQFTSITGTKQPLSMDVLRIVTQSRDEAVAAAASSDMKYEERLKYLTKFRLVVDAITANHQPLWTEMESQIMSAFDEAQQAVESHDSSHFHSNFNRFLSLYNVIYPSMKIDVPIENIQKLDARINFIDVYRTEIVNNPTASDEMENLKTDLEKLFDSMDEDDADPSIWWVIISTGSIIIATLSYVGFRKYQGEKAQKKDRSRDQKD